MNTISRHYSQQARKNSGKLKLALLLFFCIGAFFSTTYAQQPACNLTGQLKAQFNAAGGSSVVINADVLNATPGTVYHWEFISNSSNATIVSGQGTESISLKAGNQAGNFSIKLTVSNPDPSGNGTLSCTCSKSVSVNQN